MTETARVDPVVQAIQDILEVSDEDFQKLIKCLSGAPISHRESEAEGRVKEAVPDLTEEKARAIVGFSTAFAGVLTQMVDQEQFLESVTNRTEDDLPPDKREGLKSRLKALFQAPSIAFIGGGKAALRDNLKMVVRSQIHTDMRPIPVFADDAAKYFTVLHRLKFDYTDEIGAEPDKSVEMVLDFEDLKELRDRIQNALNMQSSIQRTAANLGGAVYFPYTIEGDGNE